MHDCKLSMAPWKDKILIIYVNVKTIISSAVELPTQLEVAMHLRF